MPRKENDDFVMLPTDASEEEVHKLLDSISKDMGAIETLKGQKAKLDARVKSAENRIAIRREAISTWMTANNHKSVRLALATLSMAETKPKVIITEEDKLPLDCFQEKVVRSVNKDLVKARLLTGAAVPGATLSNAAPDLRIRW